MKYKITDLMDLYEDNNCPLAPFDQPTQKHDEEKELYKLKQSKHAFGLTQVLAVAASVTLLVLGGFGIKKLISVSLNHVPKSSTSITTSVDSSMTTNEATQETPPPVNEYDTEKQELSRFLTTFAALHIENSRTDLADDAALVHFAFQYRSAHDSASIHYVSEPFDNKFRYSLTLEEVNETLSTVFGKQLSPVEGGKYSLKHTDPYDSYDLSLISPCIFHDNQFWFETIEEGDDNTVAIVDSISPEDNTAAFTVYRVNLIFFVLYPNVEVSSLPACSVNDVDTFVSEGALTKTRKGTAVVETLDTGYQLVEYATEASNSLTNTPNTANSDTATEPDKNAYPTYTYVEKCGSGLISGPAGTVEATFYEEPVYADVDGDGYTELIACCTSDASGERLCRASVSIFGLEKGWPVLEAYSYFTWEGKTQRKLDLVEENGEVYCRLMVKKDKHNPRSLAYGDPVLFRFTVENGKGKIRGDDTLPDGVLFYENPEDPLYGSMRRIHEVVGDKALLRRENCVIWREPGLIHSEEDTPHSFIYGYYSENGATTNFFSLTYRYDGSIMSDFEQVPATEPDELLGLSETELANRLGTCHFQETPEETGTGLPAYCWFTQDGKLLEVQFGAKVEAVTVTDLFTLQ